MEYKYVKWNFNLIDEVTLKKQQLELSQETTALTEASLVLLTRRFVDMVVQKHGIINIKKVVGEFKVPKRKVYNIINVLEGVGLVERATSLTDDDNSGESDHYDSRESESESVAELTAENLEKLINEERFDEEIRNKSPITITCSEACDESDEHSFGRHSPSPTIESVDDARSEKSTLTESLQPAIPSPLEEDLIDAFAETDIDDNPIDETVSNPFFTNTNIDDELFDVTTQDHNYSRDPMMAIHCVNSLDKASKIDKTTQTSKAIFPIPTPNLAKEKRKPTHLIRIRLTNPTSENNLNQKDINIQTTNTKVLMAPPPSPPKRVLNVKKQTTIDEEINLDIRFGMTDDRIVKHFLELWGSYPILWPKRAIDGLALDHAIESIQEELNKEWHMKMSLFDVYRSLSNIKSWYSYTLVTRSEDVRFPEYYEILSHFLPNDEVFETKKPICYTCWVEFKDEEAAETHSCLYKTLRNVPFKCRHCRKFFSNRIECEEHENEHKNDPVVLPETLPVLQAKNIPIGVKNVVVKPPSSVQAVSSVCETIANPMIFGNSVTTNPVSRVVVAPTVPKAVTIPTVYKGITIRAVSKVGKTPTVNGLGKLPPLNSTTTTSKVNEDQTVTISTVNEDHTIAISHVNEIPTIDLDETVAISSINESSTVSTIFKCQFCDNHFLDLIECRTHEIQHQQPIKSVKPVKSVKPIKSVKPVKKETNTTTPPKKKKPYSLLHCRFCNEVFFNPRRRQAHEKLCFGNPEKTSSQSSGKKLFDKLIDLDPDSDIEMFSSNSQNADTDDDCFLQLKFTCRFCDEKFVTPFQRQTHEKIHFKTEPKLVKRIRTKDGPCICEICGKKLRSRSNLKHHKRRHEPPIHKCTICGKGYYENFNFNEHMRMHNDQRDYICEMCGKTFVRQKQYMTHMKCVHDNQAKCQICGSKYTSPSALTKHLKTAHTVWTGTLAIYQKRRFFGRRSYFARIYKPRKRKYLHVVDPVTKAKRLGCVLCEKTYAGYCSLYEHLVKIHGVEPTRRPKKNKDKQEEQEQQQVENSTSQDDEVTQATLNLEKPLDGEITHELKDIEFEYEDILHNVRGVDVI